MTKQYLKDTWREIGGGFLLVLAIFAGVVLTITYCAALPIDHEYDEER